MTSTERVREFRERNPDYDRRWKARREARAQARVAALQAHAVVPAETPLLMLPAPVRDPALAALDALAASLASRSAREMLPIAARTSRPANQSRAA
ncbi:MAG: hypothetical protein WBD40_16765 [Tepidisphaeraceae bacterium]